MLGKGVKLEGGTPRRDIGRNCVFKKKNSGIDAAAFNIRCFVMGL